VRGRPGPALALAAIFALAAIGMPSAAAQTYTVLHTFTGSPEDGAYPYARLTLGPAGNLYGATEGGGESGFGTVFKLDPSGTETLLHSFTGGADGSSPRAQLIRDSRGYLYGTTAEGGASEAGIVFKLDTAGTETVLYNFTGGADGKFPEAGLIRDPAGNLYGTTLLGGQYNNGAVFELDTSGTESMLNSLGGSEGSKPQAGLVRDSAGNLYGTTSTGAYLYGGAVFKLSKTGEGTVLHEFTGLFDGGVPLDALILDAEDNLYGTASMGGTLGYGVVFKVDGSGNETVLHNFLYGTDGYYPVGGMIRDSAGNLYGTTYYGGTSDDGIVFKLDTNGNETVLHTFTGVEGANPAATLVRDAAGNLYGTTYNGGTGNCVYGCGVVFKIAP
jgi:uncharacterized repeat protein (TIGR03803 family)